jgi:hypothetical protein
VTRQGQDLMSCGEESRQLLPDKPACAGDGYFHISISRRLLKNPGCPYVSLNGNISMLSAEKIETISVSIENERQPEFFPGCRKILLP